MWNWHPPKITASRTKRISIQSGQNGIADEVEAEQAERDLIEIFTKAPQDRRLLGDASTYHPMVDYSDRVIGTEKLPVYRLDITSQGENQNLRLVWGLALLENSEMRTAFLSSI